MIDNRVDPAMLPKHWKINDAIDTMDEIIKVLEGHWEWKTSGVWNTHPDGRQFGDEPERDMIDYIRDERQRLNDYAVRLILDVAHDNAARQEAEAT
tara:strand:+ start:1899 stop:2186 length:288 start_codon:yes stop_codon:yes gene_type:complete